jgi:hypothetical protein
MQFGYAVCGADSSALARIAHVLQRFLREVEEVRHRCEAIGGESAGKIRLADGLVNRELPSRFGGAVRGERLGAGSVTISSRRAIVGFQTRCVEATLIPRVFSKKANGLLVPNQKSFSHHRDWRIDTGIGRVGASTRRSTKLRP